MSESDERRDEESRLPLSPGKWKTGEIDEIDEVESGSSWWEEREEVVRGRNQWK